MPATGPRARPPSGSRRSNSCGFSTVDLAPDFDEFCALLSARGVEFVIVGAYALAFHGVPRFTGDLDILVRPTEQNAVKLLHAIDSFGFPTHALAPADVISGVKIIEMGVPPVQLHLMSHIDGVTWDEVWNSRLAGPFGAREVWFIGRDAFVRNKKAAGRLKDLADIAALEEQDR